MEIYRQDNPPDTASENDRWVDTHDEDKIYVATEDYDYATDYAELVVEAASRPAAALTFTAVEAGNAGRNIQVRITNYGASGTASLTKTGSGTRGSPYVYAFKVYDNSGSNNDLIALLSGDAHLTASGSSATQGECADLAATALDTGVMDILQPQVIVIRYAAELPSLTGTSSTINESIPSAVRNSLAEAVAARLALSNSGIAVKPMLIESWETRYRRAVSRARANVGASSYPTDMQPG